MSVRITKKIPIILPEAMVKEAEKLAKHENRTMSELIREALRQYRAKQRAEREDLQWANQIIAEAHPEQQESPMTREELLAESRRLARSGARQAKKLGIKTTDTEIVRLIHKQRATRNA